MASEGVWGVMLIFLVISTGVGDVPVKMFFHFGSAGHVPTNLKFNEEVIYTWQGGQKKKSKS